jgi:capsular polysaccharide transport system ATP-binding protein
MISIENVSKSLPAKKGAQAQVLRDVYLHVPVPLAVGVVGAKDPGKSVLMNLIAGIDTPTSGTVVSSMRVSHPVRFKKNLQRLLSARQNARFICRIAGHEDDLEERIARVEQICRLGARFDKPVGSLSRAHKARLGFALSWAIDFDVYVADAFNFAGDLAFGSKELAESELQSRMESAGLVLGAQRVQDEGTLRQWCKAGIWVHDGKADWFDAIDDALAASRQAASATTDPGPAKGPRKEGRRGGGRKRAAHPALEEIRSMHQALAVLAEGAKGNTPQVETGDLERLLRVATAVGMELVTMEQMERMGLPTPAGAAPVLRVPGGDNRGIDYFDLKVRLAPGRAGRAGAKARQEE